MEAIVAVGMGLVGSWIIARLFAAGEKSVVGTKGYFVSDSFTRKRERAIRSEFSANAELVKGVVR